jgi:hypothetical protein
MLASDAVASFDNVKQITNPDPEVCPRCGAEMIWVHQSMQCPRCKLKLGCCQGVSPDEG